MRQPSPGVSRRGSVLESLFPSLAIFLVRLVRVAILVLTVLAMAPRGTHAAVVRVEIQERGAFAEGIAFGRSGAYERVRGTIHFAADPAAAVNERIVDLKLAPRNARGLVEFRADFFLLKPVDESRGNRRLLYDVNNRGNKLALGAFNDKGGNDPRTPADAGNGFLMREGYSLLWCGWNGDVKAGDGRLTTDLPVAREGEAPIVGRVLAEITVNELAYSQPLYWGNSDPYPSVSFDQGSATLTRRASRTSPAEVVPPDQWAFARFEKGASLPDDKQLSMKEGFRPGWIYELIYTARDPRVTGLGFAAVRDLVSFLRNPPAAREGEKNPLTNGIERAYIFGISQSGRFIQHFLYEGFNADEQGRMVFDAALLHVGGGGRGSFNHRFAQTTRHGSQHEEVLFPSELFPFNSVPQEDPITGEKGDLLARCRVKGVVPKMFYTETSTEYWCRAASLLHTDVEGRRDTPLDPNARLYFIAGAQHGVATSPDRGIYQNPNNVLDHRPVLRALLTALDEWVSTGTEPPPSTYPRIDDGTLVDFETWKRAFPSIPEVNRPEAFYVPHRLDFGPRFQTEGIVDFVPPKIGPAYHTLVPAVDGDGNELAGVRLPDVAVPTATYTGWNLRGERAGATGALGRWSGSYLPLSRTAEERQKLSDPRPALLDRYSTRADYLEKYATVALQLRDERFLLDVDVVRLLGSARKRDFWEKPAGLTLHWADNFLTIRGNNLPGGELRVMYLEAYCRPGSTDRDWGQTVIGHRTELVSASEDGRFIRLKCTLKDGVIVEHEIRAEEDEVDFRLKAHNPTETDSQAHWAQPCIRVDRFTGGKQADYFRKGFIFLDGKLAHLPTPVWATKARYVPGQVWCPAGVDRNDVNPRPLNDQVPSNGLIGCFSADDKWIMATAFEPYQELFQGVAICLHSDFRIGGLKPGESKAIRGKIYLMPADVEKLVERYAADFPDHHAPAAAGK